MIMVKLLLAFMKIGAFSIGGGYVSLPLIQEEVVYKYSWLTMNEFADIITIAEMTPGPIVLNAATFVGTKVGGFAGAVIATLGVISIPFIIIVILAKLYFKYNKLEMFESFLSGLRPAVIGMISAAGVSIIALAISSHPVLGLDFNVIAMIMVVIGYLCLRVLKVNSILVIILTGCIGGFIYSVI